MFKRLRFIWFALLIVFILGVGSSVFYHVWALGRSEKIEMKPAKVVINVWQNSEGGVKAYGEMVLTFDMRVPYEDIPKVYSKGVDVYIPSDFPFITHIAGDDNVELILGSIEYSGNSMKETASEAIKGVCNLVGSKKDARVWIKIWDREGRYLLTNNVFLRQLENVPVEVIFSEMNGEKKIVYSRLGDLCGEGDTSE